MLNTSGSPNYIATHRGVQVPLVAQLMDVVHNFSQLALPLKLYIASLFIQIFYIVDNGLFWNSLGNNWNLAQIRIFNVLLKCFNPFEDISRNVL